MRAATKWALAAVVILGSVLAVMLLNYLFRDMDHPSDFRVLQVERLEGRPAAIDYPLVVEQADTGSIKSLCGAACTLRPRAVAASKLYKARGRFTCILAAQAEATVYVVHPLAPHTALKDGTVQVREDAPDALTMLLAPPQCLVLPEGWIYEVQDAERVRVVEVVNVI